MLAAALSVRREGSLRRRGAARRAARRPGPHASTPSATTSSGANPCAAQPRGDRAHDRELRREVGVTPSVGEGEGLERGQDLFGAPGGAAVAVAPGDVDVGDGVERLLLVLARDVGHDHRVGRPPSATRPWPRSPPSPTRRTRTGASRRPRRGRPCPRGPTAAIEDPTAASEAQRAPGASPCTTRSRSTVPAAGSARRMVYRRLMVPVVERATASIRSCPGANSKPSRSSPPTTTRVTSGVSCSRARTVEAERAGVGKVHGIRRSSRAAPRCGVGVRDDARGW